MTTPDAIKMGLEFCSRCPETLTACKQCPYVNIDDGCYEVLRDALDYIKNLEGDVKFYQNLYNVHADTIDFHEQYEKQLEQRLASVGKTCPEWISVKDRLPEDNVDVIVYAVSNNGDYTIVITFHTHRLYGLNIEGWASPWQYFFMNYTITHWMPLPGIPKEE